MSLPDSFLVGANLPWMTYGCDFGANAWQPEGGLGRPERRSRALSVLARLAAAGVGAVRWFVLADGRAGLRVDGTGRLLGLDSVFFRDVDAAVGLLRETRLRAIFVLFDFTWFSPAEIVEGVQVGGRGRLVSRRGGRRRLLDAVIAPLLERYGNERAILAWDVINEPEWAVTKTPWSCGGRLSRCALRALVRDSAAVVHQRTRQLVTVGSACASSLSLVAGLGLDFYQVHWYDHLPARFHPRQPVSPPEPGLPVLLGEFPTRGSADTPDAILDAAHASGYAGAFAWSAVQRDAASDSETLERTMADWTAAHGTLPAEDLPAEDN